MKSEGKKYTYYKPMFVSSPKQDYSIQPEIYRRYVNHIIGFGATFTILNLTLFSFILDKTVDVLFDREFSFFKLLKLFFGNYDSENRLLYGLFLLLIFTLIYKPTKKITDYLTKPVNRAVIEEGLILIEGEDVFEELDQAFDEMNNQ